LERWMGLDIGERRIGVAVSDWLGLTAQGVEVYRRRRGLKEDLAYLTERFRQLEATGLLIGFPRNMNGTVGPQADSVREFGRRLGERCGVETRNGIKLGLQLTHEELANMVGTSRQTVTSLLNTFKHENSIAYEGREISIINPDKLARWIM